MSVFANQNEIRVTIIAAVNPTGFMVAMNIANFKRPARYGAFPLLGAIERQTVIVVLNALVSYGMLHQIIQNGNVDFSQRFMDCRPALRRVYAPIAGPVFRRPCLDIGYRQDEQPSDIAKLPALTIRLLNKWGQCIPLTLQSLA